jgi:hypothetical protein
MIRTGLTMLKLFVCRILETHVEQALHLDEFDDEKKEVPTVSAF